MANNLVVLSMRLYGVLQVEDTWVEARDVLFQTHTG